VSVRLDCASRPSRAADAPGPFAANATDDPDVDRRFGLDITCLQVVRICGHD
jgi:hypothetical protein